MLKPLARVLTSLGLVLVVAIFQPQPVTAAACGINVDPANGQGHPPAAAVRGVDWVRIEYKDCTQSYPPTESLDMYRKVLGEYEGTSNVLLVIDYMTYPQGQNNLEELAKRVECIHHGCEGVEGLGNLVDAYEIWNEPDLSHVGDLTSDEFAGVANAVLPILSDTTTVLGGFASGQPGYLESALSQISSGYTAVGIHPYGQDVGAVAANGFGQMSNLVAAYKNVSSHPVWITEIGMESKDNARVANYLEAVYGNNVGADVIIWFAWSDGMVAPFGITDPSQQAKNPIYSSFFNACQAIAPNVFTSQAAITPPAEAGVACGGSGNSENNNINPYYLYPIDGFLPGLYNDDQRREIAAVSMIKQGYEVYCAAPDLSLMVDQENADLWKEVFGENNDSTIPGVLGTEQIIDYTQSTIPMWRASGAKDLFGSLETYWGYLDTSASADSQGLTSAPIYSLLTTQEQCFQEIHMLRTIHNMCNQLEDPSSCALYQPIEESSYDTESLYAAVGYPTENDKISSYCQRLTSDQNFAPDIAQSLKHVPLYLDKAYRLGFLVVTAELEGDYEAADNYTFNFLRNQSGSTPNGSPKHEVRIIAFKIPDSGTNKDFESDIYYEDGLQLTRSILLTLSQKEKYKQEINDRKNSWIERVTSPIPAPPTIDCNGVSPCHLAIPRSIVDLVNTAYDYSNPNAPQPIHCQGTTAEDLAYEPSSTIKDSASLETSPEQAQTTLGKMLEFLKLNLVLQKIDEATELPFSFLSQLNVNPNKATGPDNPVFTSYLVLPQGSDLKNVEDTLAGVFFTQSEIAQMRSDPNIPQYFKMGDISQDFDSTKHSLPFRLPPNICEETFDENGNINDSCVKELKTQLKDDEDQDVEPRIQGGFLGNLMREIQKSLHDVTSEAHQYISSCETTEQFLTGNCRGGRNPGTSPGLVTGLACSEFKNQTVALPASMTELKNLTCQVAQRYSMEPSLLWGLLQIEGSPMLRRVRAGETSVSCADLIFNECGASQIVGILVPACIDTQACPQAAYLANDEAYSRAITPEVACSVEGSLDYIAKIRMSETSYLKGLLDESGVAYSGAALEKQLNYMRAGRNLGVKETDLVQPACGNDVVKPGGCNELNYCECAVDGFDGSFYDGFSCP